MRQYALMILVMGGACEAFSLVRGWTFGFGFGVTDAAIAVLYVVMVIVVLARAPLHVLTLYVVGGLAAAQIPTFIHLGFAGAASLLPCTIPVVAALFLGTRAAYIATGGGLAIFVAVALLRIWTHWLPPFDTRLVDPERYINWVGVALVLTALVGPVVWLIMQLTAAVDEAVGALAEARAAHDAKVRLRVAADEALEKTIEQRHRARRAEASGLLVAGVVHDLRNHLNVLQIWSESLRDEPSADVTVREAAARVQHLCAEAARVTREVFAIARGPNKAEATCNAAAETRSVGGLLKEALPSDFELAVSVEIAEDRTVALDRFALASTTLEIAAAAEVTRSAARRVRLATREPDDEERGALAGCVAVIELSLGDAPGPLTEGLIDDVARRGARLIAISNGAGENVARLLLPGLPRGTAAQGGGDA